MWVGEYSKVIWCSKLSWKCTLATVKCLKANVSSVGPLSGWLEDLWVVCGFICRKWSYAFGGNTMTWINKMNETCSLLILWGKLNFVVSFQHIIARFLNGLTLDFCLRKSFLERKLLLNEIFNKSALKIYSSSHDNQVDNQTWFDATLVYIFGECNWRIYNS